MTAERCVYERSSVVPAPSEAHHADHRLADRIPDPAEGRTVRTVSEVDPSERQEAIARLVIDSKRVDDADLKIAFARLFGWRRAGVDIKMAFQSDLNALLRSGAIRRDSELLVPG